MELLDRWKRRGSVLAVIEGCMLALCPLLCPVDMLVLAFDTVPSNDPGVCSGP